MNILKLLLVLALGFTCLAVSTTVFFADKSVQLQEELEPANVVVMDAGVFVPLASVKSAFGEATPVRVHASPPDADTMGARSTDVDGTVHVWVPTRYLGGISSLTPAEAQEYVLRELAKCDGTCQVDYATAGLNPVVVREMASDEAVERMPETTSDALAVYVQNELYKYSLKTQSEDHRYALDTVAKVAESGDRAQVNIVWAMITPNIVIGVVAVIAVAVIILVLKGAFNGGGGGGGA